MKRKYISKIVLFLAFSAGLMAQSKTGTTIGQFLKIEPNAKNTAMGNVGVAIYGDASSTFYNPANLGFISGTDVEFSHNKWLADINYNHFIGAMNLGSIGTVSLQITSLTTDEMDVRTVEQPDGTGEKYSVSNFGLGLGYGLKLTDRVSLGLTLSYLRESIWHCSLEDISLNFGVLYSLSPDGFKFGASVSNFGPRASYSGRDLYANLDMDPDVNGDNDKLPSELRTDSYSLPTTFRVGASYPIQITEDYKLTLAADAITSNDNDQKINVGTELYVFDMFAIRAGYRDLLIKDSEGGLTLGAGFNTEISNGLKLRFDYSWADYGRLKAVQKFTIAVGI